MNSNKRFSKKHKQLIKEVERLLGSIRAFYVDMTQSNHLVFYIEGIDKPMYTSGTPSDRKSYTNFVSDLKRALTPSESVELTEEEQEEQQLICTDQVMERCILGCAQVLRQRKAMLTQKEKQEFAEHGDVDLLASGRVALVKEQIDFQLKQRREASYIKPKMMRVLIKQVRRHLDFLLPSLSTYRHEKKEQPQPEINNELVVETNVEASMMQSGDLKASVSETPKHTAAVLELCHAGSALKTVPVEQTAKEISKPVSKKEQLRLQAEKQREQVAALAEISSNQRISLFRSLSQSTMQSLIQDLEQAMAENEAQAIDEILAKVKAFGLPKEVLIERLQQS